MKNSHHCAPLRQGLKKLRQKITGRGHGRFLRAEGGSVSVEAMFVTPGLIILMMFIYTAFSAFEAKAKANKANYTISDYISRQTDEIDKTFLDGLAELYKFLNNDGHIDMRVSAVQFVIDENNNESHELVWSYGTGDYTALSQGTLSKVENRLPLLADGEEVIVVETQRKWYPVFLAGLKAMDFADVVTTKPRFASQVLYDDGVEEVNNASHEDSDDSDVDSNGNHTGSNSSGGYYGGGRYGGYGYHRR
ncbi:hypothetical protein [uncultured Celeribacter sp.]|uniref:TadE/TadG family type IV pilus assembly protein n=1 Tax=uncultured Celeribacter sp. TaxID=1303376 RepID=UPI002AA8E93E|nr:hypothetical protein [uncultured Celeribacter sp.]